MNKTDEKLDRGLDKGARIGRRSFLKGTGAILVLVAGGGVWRAGERGVFGAGEDSAFEPWKDWRNRERGDPLALVSAAILAANAHNTQPWIFRVADDRIDLFADEKRDIGTIDPFSREMHIGLGCALENMLLAARAVGYEYQLTLAPDLSDPAHVARVDLSPGNEETPPLYEAIPKRHTNRYLYDSRPVPRETLNALGTLNRDAPEIKVFWFANREDRKKMGGLLVDAAEAINADERQAYDNGERWLRQDREAIERHRDGLTLDTAGLSSIELLAAKMLPEPSGKSLNEGWLRSLKGQTATAAAFGIIALRNYEDVAQKLRVGRLWQRMHLWMTREGLAAQPMNQIHERADRETQLRLESVFDGALADLVGDPSRRGIFTFRLGHPTEQSPPGPRRAVRDVLVGA